MLAQFPERPFQIGNIESSAFPISHGVFDAQTVEIDRNINVTASEICDEQFKILSPIVCQDRARTLSISHRTFVGPGMNFEPAFALGPTIGENIVRPPALEIPAAPNRDALDMRKPERPVDPTAARPGRRANVPVRMIIKRNKDNRLSQPAQPERAQIMKVTRAVEDERREPRAELAIKFFY